MTDANDNCCSCFKPRTGAFIIGYVTLVYILGEVIHMTVNLLTFEAPEEASDVDARTLQTFVHIVFGITLFIYALYFAFTIALIVGLHQDKPSPVLAFIKFNYFIIGIYIIGFLSFFSEFDLFSFATHIFITVATINFVVALKSYHEQMLVSGRPAGAVLTVA